MRADESLFFYSAKGSGYSKYIKKEYGIYFAETLLVSLKKNYPIRVFNLLQAKKFHDISNAKILENPKVLSFYINKNNLIYEDINILGKKLAKALEEDNYNISLKLFKKICDLYEIASAQFIIIFSLGLKLEENKDNLKNIKQIIKEHDIWRNSVAFKEEDMGESIFYFFKFLLKRKKLKTTPSLLMKYLTLSEIQNWLGGKITDNKIINIINLRKKQGFVYLNLRNNKQETIDNKIEIIKIKKYFLKLTKDSKKLKNNNIITGQVAYNPNKIIKGEVIVIKDKSELETKGHLLTGKILVSIQTTPHFIPYIKEVKAIITDEGGITCHAAIVAREMKKPCIVGTRVATQVLKDGDEVELNFDNGVINY